MFDTGALLRDSRESAGLTQSALAALAGTSQATVSAYENGSKQPTLTTFLRLVSIAGRRIVLEPLPGRPTRLPTSSELGRVARTLPAVIELAEALPHRHGDQLAYPILGSPDQPS